MQKHTTLNSALRLVISLFALTISCAMNAQYLTTHFSLGSLKIAARAVSATQHGGQHVAQALRSRPLFRHSPTKSMTHKAVQLWSAVKNFNLEIPEQEKLLIDDFLDKHQNKGGVFTPQEKSDLVITACNNFPLHLPLDPHPSIHPPSLKLRTDTQGERAKKLLVNTEQTGREQHPVQNFEKSRGTGIAKFGEEFKENLDHLPTDKQEFEIAIEQLCKQHRNHPEKLFAALEPLQLSPFVCAESARVAQTAVPFPGETAAPIELQFLFKQVQQEIGIPTTRHLSLKYCPSIAKYPQSEMIAFPSAVYILSNALSRFEIAQRVSDRAKKYAYGWFHIFFGHEATHAFYNDPYFFNHYVKKDDSLLKKHSSLLLKLIEHRADRRAFETAQCFDCAKTDVRDHGPDYLSEDERFAIARRFKAEGKICPVHQRLNALLPSYMHSTPVFASSYVRLTPIKKDPKI